MSSQTHPCLNQAGVGWCLTFEFGRKRARAGRKAAAPPEVLTGIWPAVGTYGGSNFNHHLSLPDSGWLRLLVDIFWGLDSHQNTTGWGPPLLSAQCGKHDTWTFTSKS